jgi:hypothetical protein
VRRPSREEFLEVFEDTYFDYLFGYCDGMYDGEMETTHSGEGRRNLSAEDRALIHDDCSAFVSQNWYGLQGGDPKDMARSFCHWRLGYWAGRTDTQPEVAPLRTYAHERSHKPWVWDRERRTIRPPGTD